jgi:MFS family permease
VAERRKQRRQFWVIFIIVFLGFLGISIPYLIFPVLFLNPDYLIVPISWGDSSRALFLGITLGAYPLGQFLGSPLLGSMSDDYGRKPLLTGSLIIAGLCNLLTGFAIEAQHLGFLILGRFLTGFMEGNIAIARAMAADFTTLSKHKTFGRINAAASIAFLIGPIVGGLLADKRLFEYMTASTPFYLVCILLFAVSGLSFLMLEKGIINIPATTQSFWKRINLFKRLSLLFGNKRLQFLMIISTCFTLAVDIFYEFGPVYLTIKWSLGPAQLVIYNTVLCLALAIGNGWLPHHVSSRFSNRLAVIFSIGAFALFLIGITVTNSDLMMMVLFTLSGFVIGLGVTLITVKISNSVAATIQGEVMGVQLSLRVLGDAIICFFGGVLLLISPKLILIVAAVMSIGTMCYYAAKT